MAYQTRLKKMVASLFLSSPGIAFTFEDISRRLSGTDKPPSRSSLYRLLHDMSAAGMIQQSVHPDTMKTSYRLSQGESCNHHLHFVCSQCGTSLHVDEEVSSVITGLMAETLHTTIDMKQSVLIGQCNHCSSASHEEGKA